MQDHAVCSIFFNHSIAIAASTCSECCKDYLPHTDAKPFPPSFPPYLVLAASPPPSSAPPPPCPVAISTATSSLPLSSTSPTIWSLSLSGGSLSPAFSAPLFAYVARLTASTASLTFSVTPAGSAVVHCWSEADALAAGASWQPAMLEQHSVADNQVSVTLPALPNNAPAICDLSLSASGVHYTFLVVHGSSSSFSPATSSPAASPPPSVAAHPIAAPIASPASSPPPAASPAASPASSSPPPPPPPWTIPSAAPAASPSASPSAAPSAAPAATPTTSAVPAAARGALPSDEAPVNGSKNVTLTVFAGLLACFSVGLLMHQLSRVMRARERSRLISGLGLDSSEAGYSAI